MNGKMKRLIAAAAALLCLGLTGCGDSKSSGGDDASFEEPETYKEAVELFAKTFYNPDCGEEFMQITTPKSAENALIKKEKWDKMVSYWNDEFDEICEKYEIEKRVCKLEQKEEGGGLGELRAEIAADLKNNCGVSIDKEKITQMYTYTVTLSGTDSKGKKFSEREYIHVYEYRNEWVVYNCGNVF